MITSGGTELGAAFAQAQAIASELVDSGQLEAYATSVAAVRAAHER